MTINEVIAVIDGHRKEQVDRLRNTRYLMWTMVKMWGKDAPSKPEEVMPLPGDFVKTEEDIKQENEELLDLIKRATSGG